MRVALSDSQWLPMADSLPREVPLLEHFQGSSPIVPDLEADNSREAFRRMLAYVEDSYRNHTRNELFGWPLPLPRLNRWP